MLNFGLKPLHCGMSVSDLDEALEWFDRVLGFKEVSRHDFSEYGFRNAFTRNGDFEIELFEVEGHNPLPDERKLPNDDLRTLGTKHIALAVDDLDALVRHLEANGVRIVMGPDRLIGNYYCYAHGPDEILIEFIERK